jgi:5-methylcytosine-specific restriction protein B
MNWREVVAYLDTKGQLSQPAVQGTGRQLEARGYMLPSGLQLAVEAGDELDSSAVWVEDQGPPPIPGLFQLYKPEKQRPKAIALVAPRLAGTGATVAPQRAYRIPIKSIKELEALFDWYSGMNFSSSKREGGAPVALHRHEEGPMPTALNRILYGPPGTGKTHRTAELAVQICDGDAKLPRDALMARYRQLRDEGRIGFVTFHQSYGYEEFVEGLRPEVVDGQVSYRVRPGIFRQLCDAARLRSFVTPGLLGKPLRSRTVFKMSLGPAGTVEGERVLQAALANGYVVLGWGEDVDFSDCVGAANIRDHLLSERPQIVSIDSQARYVNVLKEEVNIGDLVIVSQGNSAFRAIGEVVGPYEFMESPAVAGYHQSRAVRWLAIFDSNRPVAEIYGKNFMQSALYKLPDESLNFPALESLIASEESRTLSNFVLIVDEINRANMSKVFGELITLLEPDKREGALNALSVKLPYSGETFSVPANLFVIGTMNTADRSIALLDTALRRRFEFDELAPDPAALPEALIDGIDLRAMFNALNARIEYLYDRDHMVGHGYFMGISSLAELDHVLRRKVIPLLQEYFFEDWSKVRLVLNDSEGAFVDMVTTMPAGMSNAANGYEPRSRFRTNPEPFPVLAFQQIYR